MAEEEQSDDKTEQPSEKRLREAREKGQVPRSKELNTLVILLTSGASIWIFGQFLTAELMRMMRESFHFTGESVRTPDAMFGLLMPWLQAIGLALVPVFLLIVLMTLGGPFMMGGFVMSLQALAPKASRLNPLAGLKRMFSMKGVMELVKALIKVVIVGTCSWLIIKHQIPYLLQLGQLPIEEAIRSGGWVVIQSFVMLSASLILIAAIDIPYQWYTWHESLKMTKQALKDEYKESEGRPEVKAQIRRAQQAIAKRRMMSDIAKAQVILTNPTHYAVAIQYSQEGTKAPVVVAKGKDLIALQIQRVALANKIPLLSLPPLARAVYFSTKINAEIPRGLYIAVAQVLAYIFQLKDKQYYDNQPRILSNLPIPDELQRDAEENAHG